MLHRVGLLCGVRVFSLTHIRLFIVSGFGFGGFRIEVRVSGLNCWVGLN